MTTNLTQMLQPGGIVPIDIPTTAALVAEIKRQHAALERKDALLRQALAALTYHTEQTRPIQQTIDAKLALEQELAK